MRNTQSLTQTCFLVLAALFANSSAFADDETLKTDKKKPAQEQKLDYSTERRAQKLMIGIQIRTFNEECPQSLPKIWNKFMSKGIAEKIPNRIDGNVFAVYTDYEGDHTKPFTYFVGCEVSTLDNVPDGMVSKVIPEANYAVFSSKGPYPLSLVGLWSKIWKSNLDRSYTTDYEVYKPDFDVQNHPHLKLYVALKD